MLCAPLCLKHKYNLSMKRYTTLLLALLITVSAFAAEPRHRNPNLNSVNREPMRSTFIAYPSVAEAQSGSEISSPLYRSIDGVWKFLWLENVLTPNPEGFAAVKFDDSEWKTMPIPGMWELNGYGDPVYISHGWPWLNWADNTPPFPPKERNYKGLYRREVEVPAEWKGKNIYVHFGSVTSNITLWVNGREVGYSEDSKLEAVFDITPYVKVGAKNTFTMEVHRWCDGTFFEDQDMWRMTGFARESYIYARDKRHIKDVKFVAGLQNEYRDGLLNLTAEATQGVKALNFTLVDKSGKEVCRKSVPFANGKLAWSCNVKDVEAWSAEVPTLYKLVVEATDGKQTIEATAFDVGFRTVEIRNNQVLVNGKAVLFKGVNRHEMHPESGYHLTKEDMERDMRVLKELNINAVRTCHYPDDPYWYDLCNRYGIYLMSEADVETHGYGYGPQCLAKHDIYLHSHLERNQRMVLRGFNHPSIVMWSLGNEAGNGVNFHKCYDWIKAYDKSRPVSYAEACHIRRGIQSVTAGDTPENYNSDIESPMYVKPSLCEKYLQAPHKRPFIMSEYAHAMGNAMGGFYRYWDLVRKYPTFQGGFIWDFADQALAWRDSQSGKVFYRYGGCYNDFDAKHPGPMHCNGVVSATREWHPHAWEVKHQHQNIWATAKDAANGLIEIYNENFFRSLDNIAIKWSVTSNGNEIISGTERNLNIKAQERKVLSLDYNNADVLKLDGEVILTLRYLLNEAEPMLAKGYEVGFNQIVINGYDAKREFADATKLPKDVKPLEIESRKVRGADFELEFNGLGYLASYKQKGEEMLTEPLKPNFYRAMTENDWAVRGHKTRRTHYHSWKLWRDADIQLESFRITNEGEKVVVKAQHRYRDLGVDVIMTYTIDGCGNIAVNQLMQPQKNHIECLGMLRFGVAMAMPKSYDGIEFYGAGPHESYNDRITGAPVGIYKQSVDEQFCLSHVRPQESGAHCELRWWRITNAKGKGFDVCSDILFTANAIPYRFSQLDKLDRDYRPHPVLLEKDGNTYVYIDMKHKGLDCVNTWGCIPPEEDQVLFKEQQFNFVLRPLR